MTCALELEKVAVRRNERVLLDEVDLRIENGAVLALTGPSGSGKTTLLRIIVGLEAPTRGSVLLAGRCVSAPGQILVPPEERRIAMVFQDLGLWPHMSVVEHLDFALAAQRWRKDDREPRVHRMLQSVGLEGRERQRPASLSGGERQRLAIARALVVKPSIVLLDEPLANLDVVLKSELIALFRTLLGDRGVTAVCVTHDPREVFALTQEFAVLEHGRIVQVGSFTELTRSPATPFVRSLTASAAAPA